ncbi:GNAT family N-acetyltransferase [Brevibacillus borstelensis]|uniref:GNAT family N-acetyltransferase n=1 Tax=Brevibacillus borstelensis TaxID=45462 RepID=UPI0030BAAA6F
MELVLCDKHQKEILLNLYQLYLHDLSEYSSYIEIGSHGLFDFGNNHLYWEKKDSLYPYLIIHNGLPVGFILLAGQPYTFPDTDYSLQEIFLLRNHRRKGLGRQAIRQLFNIHPGKYYVCQLAKNNPALSFFRNLYREFDIPYRDEVDLYEGQEVAVQKFHSSPMDPRN